MLSKLSLIVRMLRANKEEIFLIGEAVALLKESVTCISDGKLTQEERDKLALRLTATAAALKHIL